MSRNTERNRVTSSDEGNIMKQARIVLADDHNLLVEALEIMLSPHFEVVGTFSNGRELLEGAPALNPEVIVLDIGMPVLNGLRAGARIKKILPRVK
jgi:DNA-binding NarL/FixJ family response regulator